MNTWMCPRCGSHQDMIIREVPPASVLMTHILNGLHVAVDYFEHANQGDIQQIINPE